MHSHLPGTPLRGEFNEVVLLKMPVLFINHGAKEATSPPPLPPLPVQGRVESMFAFFQRKVV